MKISYCILSFNRKDKLLNLLTQLQQTRVQDSEIVIVDNGSVDGTKEALLNTTGVKCIFNSTNLGVSKGWNQLFQNSSGELVFIFNDDYALVKGGWEQLYLDTLVAKPGIMAFPRTWSPVGSENYTNFIVEGGGKYTHNFRLFGIPRIIYDRVGGFDEGFFYAYEDTDFNMKAFQLGYPLLEMNTDTVSIQHLRDTSPKDIWDQKKEEIHGANLGRNSELFYKKWSKGV